MELLANFRIERSLQKREENLIKEERFINLLKRPFEAREVYITETVSKIRF